MSDQQSGTISRVSIGDVGNESNNYSGQGSISGNGRFIAFTSCANNLVAADTNFVCDIFVRDLQLGTTTRASVDSSGVQSNFNSESPSISADGRYVAFFSYATNLVTNDTNGQIDIFVRDLQLGTTIRVSVDSAGLENNGESWNPLISKNGRFVVFSSSASNLVSGDINGENDIFVRDLQLGTTIRASVDSSGLEANSQSDNASISDDGRYVSFESYASNLVAGDLNTENDIFVRDLQLSTTTRATLDSIGLEANGGSKQASISGDGRYVAFGSSASNLVVGDVNGNDDVFIRDLQLATTTRVCENGRAPKMSLTGGHLAFGSSSTDIIPGDLPATQDVFFRDIALGTNSLVSGYESLVSIMGSTGATKITNSGLHVLLQTRGANIDALDKNNDNDVYRYEVSTNNTERLSLDQLGQEISGATTLASINTDGSIYQLISFGQRLTGAGVPGQSHYAYTVNENNSSIFLVTETSSLTPFLLNNNLPSSLAMTENGINFVISSTNLNLTNDTGGGIYKKSSSSISPVYISPSEDVGSGGRISNQSISSDGRYVVFISTSSNVVLNDSNGCDDVFVRDMQTGTTVRASVTSAGAQANCFSPEGSISANGRYVVFSSNASNLVTGDTNGVRDIFIRDLQLGTTTRISVDTSGSEANDSSYSPSISSDGRYVVFLSYASNLVAGDSNGYSDIFLRDMQLGTTVRVSVDSSGTEGNGESDSSSSNPSVSDNGRYVAFISSASNLVANDTNGTKDVFVRDTLLEVTVRASVSSTGVQAVWGAETSTISGDGRIVAFRSNSNNLVPGDTNGAADVFVRDLQLGTTTRASVSSSGTQGNYSGDYPRIYIDISQDGRFVVFQSGASNLVPGDTNGQEDIFVRDLQLGVTERVSIDNEDNQINGNSSDPSISEDGKHVSFRLSNGITGGAALTPGQIFRRKLAR